MKDTEIETVSGKYFDLAIPDPKAVHITDIGWAISRISRFNGHTIQVLPYSVGQHCLAVEEYLEKFLEEFLELSERDKLIIRLRGLLHDAGEAYTGDISGPLKKIPELRAILKPIEKKIDEAIFKGLKIPKVSNKAVDVEAIIKMADIYCQNVEAYNFMPSRGLGWSNRPEINLLALQEFDNPRPSPEVYSLFMKRYDTLTRGIAA